MSKMRYFNPPYFFGDYDGNGLNYIEAIKYIQDYCKAVNRGSDPYSIGLYDAYNLPNNFNKDKLIDAYKLFYAHTFFFGTYSIEEIKIIRFKLHALDLFVDEWTMEESRKCYAYTKASFFEKLSYPKDMKQTVDWFIRFTSNLMNNFHKKEELDNFIDYALDISIDYRKIAGKAFKEDHPDQIKIFADCIENYYHDIYDYLNWEKNLTSLYTFNSFNIMQDLFCDEDVFPYLEKYKKEIFSEIKITDIF